MSDMDFGWELYPPDDERNPFFGLYGLDEDTPQVDPHEGIERAVLDELGIESFDAIFIQMDERDIENARGNRFENIQEAIVYLFDAGILQFSGVVIGAEEVEIEIDSETGKSNRKR